MSKSTLPSSVLKESRANQSEWVLLKNKINLISLIMISSKSGSSSFTLYLYIIHSHEGNCVWSNKVYYLGIVINLNFLYKQNQNGFFTPFSIMLDFRFFWGVCCYYTFFSFLLIYLPRLLVVFRPEEIGNWSEP